MNIVGIPALIETYENYIWVMHDNVNAWIIDPGEFAPIASYLKTKNLSPKAILITHQHHDHVNGVAELKAQYPDITVYGPKLSNLALYDVKVEEGDEIKLNEDLIFKVLDTPGHTPDHIAYYNENALFCGDTLFAGGCGRILGGTAEQFAASILKLRTLADDINFYSAHEYTGTNLAFALEVEPDNQALQQRQANFTTDYPAILAEPQSNLAIEKQTNPFLRFDKAPIKQALIARGADDNSTSLFQTLRAWKDEFDHRN